MRLHNPAITGSLTVSGSLNVDFTSATGGVSGSFRPSDIKAALPRACQFFCSFNCSRQLSPVFCCLETC